MNLLFTACALIGLTYFVFVPRVFDWLAMAYAAACIYMLPAFLGYARMKDDVSVLQLETYLICLAVLAAILLTAIVFDSVRRNHSPPVRKRTDNDLALATTLLGCLGMYLTINATGNSLLDTNKQAMMGSLPIWSLLWCMGSITGFVFCASSRSRLLLLIDAFNLLLLWYIGFRYPLVLAALSTIVPWIAGRGVKPVVGNWKLAIWMVLLLAVVFSYKKIYVFVKAGDWRTAMETLSADNFLGEALLNSEAMSQLHILNTVVECDYRLPIIEHGKDTIINTFLPGESKKEHASFGDSVQADLYPRVGWGIASNIWAEMYALGGLALVGAFILIYCGVLYRASASLNSGGRMSECIISAWMPYWAFYIHRNDTYRLLSFLKQYVALLIAAGAAVVVIQIVRQIGKSGAPRSMPASGLYTDYVNIRH